MHVTIIGGGVCGLALSHQLAPDHDVTGFDAPPGPRGRRYLFVFSRPGAAAAERMGVLDELRSRATLYNGARWERLNRRISGRIDVTSLIGDGFEGYFSFVRHQ